MVTERILLCRGKSGSGCGLQREKGARTELGTAGGSVPQVLPKDANCSDEGALCERQVLEHADL